LLLPLLPVQLQVAWCVILQQLLHFIGLCCQSLLQLDVPL
jgi:hypothetical protein